MVRSLADRTFQLREGLPEGRRAEDVLLHAVAPDGGHRRQPPPARGGLERAQPKLKGSIGGGPNH